MAPYPGYETRIDNNLPKAAAIFELNGNYLIPHTGFGL